MSLTNAYMQSLKSTEQFDAGTLKQFTTLIILFIILDILIMVYAISCIISCHSSGNLPTWVMVVLLILCVLPPTSLITSFIFIIYYHVSCKQAPKTSKFRCGM